MQSLKIVKGRESGNLFSRKPYPDKEGVTLTVHSTPATSTDSKFIRAAFSPCGERFCAADQLGQLFIFDLHKNRYNMLLKGQRYCTALDFPSLSLIVAAFSDETVKVIDSASQQVVGDLSVPNVTVTSLSHHEAGRYLLTCSPHSGALWDLETFTKKRTLTGADNIGLKDVLFMPGSNVLLTCFRDDSIVAWDCETLENVFNLYKQPGEQPAFTTFCSTGNGEYFIAGGRSRYLHVWKTSTKKLNHIVQLPDKVKSVKQLTPLPQLFDQNNTVFGALSQDGVMRFVSLNTYKIVFTVGDATSSIISQVAVSPTGKHLVAVLSDGSLQLYNIRSLTRHLNTPPVPLVKAVTVPQTDIQLRHVPDETRKRRCFNENPNNLAQITNLDIKKLKKILRGFGEYPEKYRHFIWRLMLKLPENNEAYGVLLDKGVHPAFAELHKTCPVKSPKLQRCLQRVLSCLGHWSSIFTITDFLPMLAFPFVKMFQNNHLVAFEVIATFILNWCQLWFEYFPHPPVNILTSIENILNFHDPKVVKHLIANQISPKIYCWPLLYTAFSEVLTANEWMILIDHVISNHPGFLLCICAAYITCSRQALFTCVHRKDFEYYIHNRNRVSIKTLMSTAYNIWSSLPDDISPKGIISPFSSISSGDYPVFNKYPEKVVEYQLKERERIHAEEMEYIKQRQMAEEIRGHTVRLQQQEETWKREQEMLTDAERQRRQLLLEEENKLTEQRLRLQAMKRELRLREVEVLDAARTNFIANAETDHKDRLLQLEREIKRKAVLRETETKAAVEEVALKELEIATQQGLLEQELQRERYTAKRRQDAAELAEHDLENLRRQKYVLNDSVEGDGATIRLQDAQHDLARSAVKSQTLRHMSDYERARHLNAIYTEMSLNNIRNKEASEKTEKENLETVIREKTKDIYEDILEQKKAIEDQKAETLATQQRVEGLYQEIKNMRVADNKENEGHQENKIEFLRRRHTLDREQGELLRSVRNLRTKLANDALSELKDSSKSVLSHGDSTVS